MTIEEVAEFLESHGEGRCQTYSDGKGCYAVMIILDNQILITKSADAQLSSAGDE